MYIYRERALGGNATNGDTYIPPFVVVERIATPLVRSVSCVAASTSAAKLRVRVCRFTAPGRTCTTTRECCLRQTRGVGAWHISPCTDTSKKYGHVTYQRIRTARFLTFVLGGGGERGGHHQNGRVSNIACQLELFVNGENIYGALTRTARLISWVDFLGSEFFFFCLSYCVMPRTTCT